MLRFIQSYGFGSWNEFSLSLFPSFKYGNQSTALGLSAVLGFIANVLGFSPLIVAVMLVAILVETWTGISASRKKGHKFESWKFSRCILKLCVWMALFFIVHSFAREMELYHSWPYIIASWVFAIMHVTMMVYFCIEYVTSIMENTAVLDGKPKDAYITAVKSFWDAMIERFKGVISTKKADKDE